MPLLPEMRARRKVFRETVVAAAQSGLQFYIPFSAPLSERRPRTLKRGDCFALFDHNGDIVGGRGSPEGLYYHDTRYVSDMRLTINGQQPLLLGSAVKTDNSLLTADLTNPDLFVGGRLHLPRDTIHVARCRYLWSRSSYERLSVRNFDSRPQVVTLQFEFACDFADIFEVRGKERTARGKLSVHVEEGSAIVFTYDGLDGKRRRSAIRFDPAPAVIEPGRARFEFRLEPGERISLFTALDIGEAADRRPVGQIYFPRMRESARQIRKAGARAASVETSNAVFNEVLARSTADLRMLRTETEFGPYPYAGIPWFSTAFGRDGILTAVEMLWADPEIARGVLRFLAATQAKDSSRVADSEPGKILHEAREGEMAILGEVPFRRYYGSVDSTPLFVLLAGLYFERTGDLETVRAIWPNVVAALDWIDEYGDRDRDGFVEYPVDSDSGLSNQGWKDSVDSVFHADGRLARGPIALCEVQGYVWAAKAQAAQLARAVGEPDRAAALEEAAAVLRDRFEDAFWCDELSTYAIALDGDKEPCRVRTSNAGQVLFSGIARVDRAAHVASQMLGPDFFTGWGIRTVAATEPRYNPMSYHNGSVWPHDNALIALGLGRYGHVALAQRLFSGIFEAASFMDLRRLPELFCGFRKIAGRGPTYYPVACSPHSWAAAVPFAMLQACLGIEFDPRAGEVRFRQPHLPAFLNEIAVRGLVLPGGRADVVLRRHGSAVSVNVADRKGAAAVSVSY
jgi:glycogen debranching enzyme